MQWLVDLVIAAIGVPPTYVEGEPSDFGNFTKVDFTTDNNTHLLDLSPLLPSEAVAVNLAVRVRTVTVNAIVRFMHPDAPTFQGRCIIRTQVANINIRAIQACGVNAAGEIAYKFTDVVWDEIGVKIRGYWK